MKPMQGFSAVVLLSVTSVVLIFSTGQMKAAVPDSLQQMYDTAQYKPLLKEISIELAKPAPKSKADTKVDTKTETADRYSLLIMKGEALIHLKEASPAQDAFTAAALIGPDANAIATAKATVVLLKRAGSCKYQPRTKPADAKTPPAAIDIVDASSRKEAFTALLTDLLDPIQPQLANLDHTTSLPPIETMARQLGDAHNVEIAATGSDTQTKDMLDKLSKRATELMKDALKPMDTELATLSKNASRKQTGGRNRTTTTVNGRVATAGSNGSATSGLSMANVTDLNTMVGEARQIYDAAGEMITIFGEAGDFKTIQSDADKIITSANKLLTQYHYPAA